jgi:DNA replication protein DnaC
VQERDQIVFPITPCPQCWPEAYGKVLMEQSGIPNLNRTFEQFNPNPAYPKLIEALTCAREWAAGAGAPILTLAGPVGTGKSHLAVAAGRAVVGRGMQVLYRSEGDLIDEMRKGIGNKTLDDLIETLRTVPYLIWDDLGASPVTESGWGDGKMDQIFDARWVGAEMGTLRTLVTTNLVTKQFHDRGLDRLASRLTDRTVGRSVNLQGAPDMRGEQR